MFDNRKLEHREQTDGLRKSLINNLGSEAEDILNKIKSNTEEILEELNLDIQSLIYVSISLKTILQPQDKDEDSDAALRKFHRDRAHKTIKNIKDKIKCSMDSINELVNNIDKMDFEFK